MRILAHLSAALVSATVVLASTVVAASAQETTITDKRADVVQYDGRDDDSGTVLGADDSVSTGVDATSARIRHTKKYVTILMRFENLTGGRVLSYAGLAVNGTGTTSYWIYNRGSKSTVTVLNRAQTKVLCTGAFTQKAGKNGSLYLRVARSCLGYPHKIKAQTGLWRWMGSLDNDDATYYDESISASRYKTTSYSSWITSS